MVTVVQFDDWVAVYNSDGKKVAEGHSLPLSEAFRAVGVEVRDLTPSEAVSEEVNDSGSVPDRLVEYPIGGLRT